MDGTHWKQCSGETPSLVQLIGNSSHHFSAEVNTGLVHFFVGVLVIC
jgi:hypothetical protein